MTDNKIQLSGIFSEGYGIVPKKLFRAIDIGKYEKLILCYMLSYTGKGLDCFPSVRKIREDLGLGNSTVCTAINNCVEKGYIDKIKLFPNNPMKHANKYILNFMSLNDSFDVPTSGTTMNSPGNKDVLPRETNNNSINNNKNNNNTYKVSDQQADQKTINKSSLKNRQSNQIKTSNIKEIKLSKEYLELRSYSDAKIYEITGKQIKRNKHASKADIISDKIINSLINKGSIETIKEFTELKKWYANSKIPETDNILIELINLKSLIDQYCLQFQEGYYPYEQSKKDKLPRKLSDIIYAPGNTACPSIFLKILFYPPKQNQVQPKKDKHPKLTKMVKDQLEIKTGNAFKENSIITYIQDLYEFWEENNLEEVTVDGEVYQRWDLETPDYQNKMGTSKPKRFFQTYIDFLKSMETSNFIISSHHLKMQGFWWENFEKYMKKEFKIVLSPSGKYLRKLAERMSEFNKKYKRK